MLILPTSADSKSEDTTQFAYNLSMRIKRNDGAENCTTVVLFTVGTLVVTSAFPEKMHGLAGAIFQTVA